MSAAVECQFYEGPWENCDKPCIVMADQEGGDGHILGVFSRIHNPAALHDLCALSWPAEEPATVCDDGSIYISGRAGAARPAPVAPEIASDGTWEAVARQLYEYAALAGKGASTDPAARRAELDHAIRLRREAVAAFERHEARLSVLPSLTTET